MVSAKHGLIHLERCPFIDACEVFIGPLGSSSTIPAGIQPMFSKRSGTTSPSNWQRYALDWTLNPPMAGNCSRAGGSRSWAPGSLLPPDGLDRLMGAGKPHQTKQANDDDLAEKGIAVNQESEGPTHDGSFDQIEYAHTTTDASKSRTETGVAQCAAPQHRVFPSECKPLFRLRQGWTERARRPLLLSTAGVQAQSHHRRSALRTGVRMTSIRKTQYTAKAASRCLRVCPLTKWVTAKILASSASATLARP